MNGSPSFQLSWNLFGNNNGSPLFQQFDWSNLSLPSLTSNGSPLNNNQPYYPFGGNYYINPIFRRTTNGSPASASGVDDGTSSISAGTAGLDKTDTIFDTDNNNNTNTFGQAFGNIFSSGLSSAGNKILNNIVKGESFLKGLSTDSLSTVAGSATGLASNLVGQGISGIMGNSRLGRGIGQGVATGLGTVGGTVVSNLLKGQGIAGNASKLFGTGNSIFTTTKSVKDASENVLKSTAGAINPYALGMSMAGTALSAITGPSKEYAGRYGNITQTMDTVYDAASAAANFIPGVGQAVSGFMTLNKGLSNIFGSTSGMTKTDAILGSAFMPAPVKWLNMLGSSKTGTFNNQSWQNSEQANSFMQNGFGNLNERFQRAMEEAGKRYGTFSHGAKNRAQKNIDFANTAWEQILQMAAQNRLQNIRSQDMTSINNQKYTQWIQGGWSPNLVGRGKQGMKIFNNATNHNIGQRLLSGAALIDNKQMILSFQNGGKAYPIKQIPEVVVNGYRPIVLDTYYPAISEYPTTGHSKLTVPINDGDPNWGIEIDKGGKNKGYNLVTSNCSDKTLEYLNKIFNKKESTFLFTTPGDVKDFAEKLGGRTKKVGLGHYRTYIPRNKNNYKILDTRALKTYQNSDGEDEGVYIHMYPSGSFKSGGIINK